MQRFAREWNGLTTISQVITVTQQQGQESFDVRHYICSRPTKFKEFATAVRGHWQIESMHWILDVVLAEDDSRIRNGDAAEKDAIWQLYLDYYQLDRQQRLPDDAKFTGAEIKSCCRLAALLDLPLVQAAQNVVPVAATAAESVERLRTWASGRCLSADQPGIYCQAAPSNGTRRRVSRDASTN